MLWLHCHVSDATEPHMKLREIRVRNFRCLVDVTVPIDDTTILVGENNSGKTALLNALRIALTRAVGGRVAQFDEYDYHMEKAGQSPETCEGITVELWFREDASGEWPESLVQALSEVIQTEPTKNINAVGLRLWSKYDATAKEIVTKWEFLALDGQPLGGKGANPANVGKFLTYIRHFHLSALRDSNDEFSPRSQYWGRILRGLKISEEQRKSVTEELTKLNDALLKADPRLEKVRESLTKAQTIMALGTGHATSIHALPLKPWDLMSKSEVVIKARGGEVDLPLARHGQGMQSLAVLFLFQAFIDVLLKPSFEPETEAILTLEEPEAHLHPQATRALAASVEEIKSQKIVSTHSPYFIQEIPFTRIRLFRRDGPSAKVLFVKQAFRTNIPKAAALPKFCADKPKFSYDDDASCLIVTGRMEEKDYRSLVTMYPKQPEVHTALKKLREESTLYLSEAELADLETYAKRIRGEVLFAHAWLLCEGQCEYLLLRYFAELLASPLDQKGIAVIDFQNNGSPRAFVGLARVFEIPWLLIHDNDEAGKKFVKEIKNHELPDAYLDSRIRALPTPNTDIELFLVKNGFAAEYMQVLADRKVTLAKKPGEAGFDEELASKLRGDKTGITIALIARLRAGGANESRVPQFFKIAINDIVAMVN
jgi:putative ATP-dependent endonuclease of OLD family